MCRRVRGTKLAGYIGAHWGIETGSDWCLEVSLREDRSRTRVGHAVADLALVRRVGPVASQVCRDQGAHPDQARERRLGR